LLEQVAKLGKLLCC